MFEESIYLYFQQRYKVISIFHPLNFSLLRVNNDRLSIVHFHFIYLYRNNRTECKLIVQSFPTIIQDNRTPFSPGASPNRARGRSPGLRKFLVVTRACPLSSISFSSEEESGECVLSCHWNPPTKANSVIMTP